MNLPRQFALLLIICTASAADAEPADTVNQSPRPQARYSVDFECATRAPATSRGGTGTPDDPITFNLKMPPDREGGGFFLFRLDHVAGRTVRIDFDTPRTKQWRTLNPLFAPIDDLLDQHPDTNAILADPALYRSTLPADIGDEAPVRRGLAGSLLPPQPGATQRWRYMPDAQVIDDTHFRIEHTFTADQDTVIVSMRVPYTPKLTDQLMRDLQQRWRRDNAAARRRAPQWDVFEVGRSPGNRPLWGVRIGEVLERNFDQPPFAPPALIDRSDRPVILFYAREFPDEHDSSWVAQGVIDFLLSDHPNSQAIRDRFTVLVIPLLDPDGAAANRYMTDIYNGFEDDPDRPKECLIYGEFFRDWVDAGNRLDLVFTLHNVESAEGPHLFTWYHDPQRLDMSLALDAAILAALPDFTSRINDRAGRFSTRLGGWLNDTFGTLMMFYEVNSQAPQRHLLIAELKAIGQGMLLATTHHLDAPASLPLRESTLKKRDRRYAIFHRYGYLTRIFDESETVLTTNSPPPTCPPPRNTSANRTPKPTG